jgi:hypothetical protein
LFQGRKGEKTMKERIGEKVKEIFYCFRNYSHP